ncbi:hypothetical protein M0813_09851 [Anaeramoeba flamelloides]|uniref:Uncharacterized protein n=1 Tax=Anaeramoeba flamelloides TaxID=1746091 RepID=A0ABQ8X420_9EUKA|nr:hypothetical protein M0813_09851 [Anaeramoeba flamelloides]
MILNVTNKPTKVKEEKQVEVSEEISQEELTSEQKEEQSEQSEEKEEQKEEEKEEEEKEEEEKEQEQEEKKEEQAKQPKEKKEEKCEGKKCPCCCSWNDLKTSFKKKIQEIDWKSIKTDVQQSGIVSQAHIILFALNILGVIFCMFLNTTAITFLTTVFVYQFTKLDGEYTEEAKKLKKSNKKLKLIFFHLPFIPFILIRGNCSCFWRAVGNMTGHSTLLYELGFRLYGKFKDTLVKICPCEGCCDK